MTVTQITIMVLLSGFASLDRLAGINIMLSRPIVIAGIVGYTFDTLLICFLIGAIFEFIGMLEVPVGTTIPKDDTFAGYATSILVSLGAASQNAISLLLCIVLVTIMVYPVTLTDRICRLFNKWLITMSAKKETENYEPVLIKIGLLIAFFRGVIIYNLAILIALGALYLIDDVHQTEYKPDLYFSLLAIFMLGYLVRFFNVREMYKPVLMIVGAVIGWWVL